MNETYLPHELRDYFYNVKMKTLSYLLRFGKFYEILASDLVNDRKNEGKQFKSTERLNWFLDIKRMKKEMYNLCKIQKLRKKVNKYKQIKRIILKLDLKRYYLVDVARNIMESFSNGEDVEYFGSNIINYIVKMGNFISDYFDKLKDVAYKNMNLVHLIVKEGNFRHLPYTEYNDLINQGIIGLIIGIHRYDFEKDKKLSTYAVYWIKQSIYEYARNNFLFKLPTELIESYNKINSLIRENKIINIEKDIAYIKKETGLDELSITEISNIAKPFNIYVRDNRDKDEYNKIRKVNMLYDFGEEDNSLLNMMREDLKVHIMNILNELEFKCLSMKFGLFDYSEMEVKEISKVLSVSSKEVNIIINKAVEKLKNIKEVREMLMEMIHFKKEMYAC